MDPGSPSLATPLPPVPLVSAPPSASPVKSVRLVARAPRILTDSVLPDSSSDTSGDFPASTSERGCSETTDLDLEGGCDASDETELCEEDLDLSLDPDLAPARVSTSSGGESSESLPLFRRSILRPSSFQRRMSSPTDPSPRSSIKLEPLGPSFRLGGIASTIPSAFGKDASFWLSLATRRGSSLPEDRLWCDRLWRDLAPARLTNSGDESSESLSLPSCSSAILLLSSSSCCISFSTDPWSRLCIALLVAVILLDTFAVVASTSSSVGSRLSRASDSSGESLLSDDGAGGDDAAVVTPDASPLLRTLVQVARPVICSRRDKSDLGRVMPESRATSARFLR
mmetsp:Transcript_37739/g.100403  ORF Transcript_37739/g.100403 Transcript_37739/m.100403 type:complete len:341 (-) Transcript_37739:379-1401(-)